jgi:hypothetical protein
MSHALTYASVPELDLAVERQKIAFPVSRETQLSETHQFVSGFNRIAVPDPNNSGKTLPIGEVPVNRPYLPYGETMDWIVKEFEEIGTPFKLRTSVIDRKNFNLYQEYLFDQVVTPPDGEGISPMVLVHGSYVKGSPLALYLGTYRFVCSNGAIVSAGGKTHLSINTHNWGNLQNKGFHDDFRSALDHYSDVSEFYAKLSDVPLSEVVEGIFKPKLIPFCMRKRVIGQLEEAGVINLNITSDRQDGEKYKAIKEEDFSTPDLITVNGDVSTWDVYNRFTNIGSNLSSSNRVLIASKSIDRVFSRLSAVA